MHDEMFRFEIVKSFMKLKKNILDVSTFKTLVFYVFYEIPNLNYRQIFLVKNITKPVNFHGCVQSFPTSCT